MIALWNKLKLAGLALAGLFVAVGIAFLRGRRAGIERIEAEQNRRRIEAVKTRKDIDDDVANLGSNDVDVGLAKWLRDRPNE